jgi:hypothetical protein
MITSKITSNPYGENVTRKIVEIVNKLVHENDDLTANNATQYPFAISDQLKLIKPYALLFFFLIFLWGLLFCYTFIPWAAGISVHPTERLDLTKLIMSFFGLTFVNLGL